MNQVPVYENLLAFNRKPEKRQILSVKLYYQDGTEDELNVSSPLITNGEDLERQYSHIKQYLDASAKDLQLLAYHAKMMSYDGTDFRPIGSYRMMYFGINGEPMEVRPVSEEAKAAQARLYGY
ncbi:hypothetical protein GCM10023187_48520 [Nibrella viscosa]|uniref:Uncharacterized protein n=1 Tax=Nibrella viscosa TaxID=1084524 RepID=A0ABP8KV36_9BACT